MKQFGPPVIPPIDEAAKGSLLNAKWEVTKDVGEHARRGLYMVSRRSLPLPLVWTFNRGLPVESCALRESTIVPGQALALLNDPKVVELARTMAGRLLRETMAADRDDRQLGAADAIPTDRLIARAWLIVLARPATADEKAHATKFLAQRETALADPKRTKRLTPLGLPPELNVSPERAAAIVELCLALLNSNEFWFVD